MKFDEISPFSQWLTAVGLPPAFPKLGAILLNPISNGDRDDARAQGSDRYYFGQPHDILTDAAVRSLAMRSVANVIPAGHGVTTLTRYVYRLSSQDAPLRSLIPVRISFEDLFELPVGDPDPGVAAAVRYDWLVNRGREAASVGRKASEDLAEEHYGRLSASRIETAISERIRHEVISSLLSEQWELTLGRTPYGELIGSDETSPEALERQRRSLRSLFETSDDLEVLFATRAPKLNQDWPELVADLFSRSNVRISIQADLSPTPIGRFFSERDQYERLTRAYSKAITAFSAAIKNIDQRAGKTSVGSVFVNKSFFLSSEALQIFESQNDLRIDKSEFPPYSRLDLFTMLAVHYRRKTGGSRGFADELAPVLDSKLIDYSENMSLSKMAEDLRDKLRAMNENDLTFQLGSSMSGIFGLGHGLEDIFSEIETWRSFADRRLDRIDERLELDPLDKEAEERDDCES